MLVSVGYRAGSVEQKDWNFSPPFPPPTTSCEPDWLWLMAEGDMVEAGVQHASNEVNVKEET